MTFTAWNCCWILRVLKCLEILRLFFRVKRFSDTVIEELPYLTAKLKRFLRKTEKKWYRVLAILDSVKELAIQIIKESQTFLVRRPLLSKISSQSFLINFVTSNMNLSVKETRLLAINELKGRFRDAKIWISSCKKLD
jgi:ATP-dependent Lon protease